MKIRFRFKQKMLTLCCVPMILLTVFSMILGLAQFKDTAVMTSIKNDKDQRWIGMQAGENIKTCTLQQGAELWYKNIEIDHKMCHAYIIPITQSSDGSVIGAMMASQSAETFQHMIKRFIMVSVAVSFVILLAVILFIFVYIGSLTKVLHDVRRVLLRVSMGDLSDDRLIRIKRSDEFGELAQGTEKLRVKIDELLSETKRGTETLKQAVEHLNATSERVAAAAKETSMNIDQISTTANTQKAETRNATEDVETTNSAINLMLDHISDINKLSIDMESSSRESQKILEELLLSSRNSQETAKDISQQVMVTNESVQQIKSVTEYITDIAEETNLLALNASIEAARAGEAGRGFAVVAEQIQKLAEQSNNSAAKIGQNIRELVVKTEGIVQAMDIIEDTLKKQEESVDKTKKIFDELNESILNVNHKESEMQKNIADMNQAKENVSNIIQQIAEAAEDSAFVSANAETMTGQMTEEMQGLTTLMEDLTDVANKLSENLELFLA